MAYTIIGQNNSVTTIDDGNGHVLHVPSRVALAIGTTFTITSVNNNMATLEDSNGIVYRDIPCVVNLVDAGGGGGSSLPDQTGHSGEFLTTDGTDASWSNKPLVNTATGTDSLSVGKATTANNVVTVVNSNAASVTTAQGSAVVGSGAVSQAKDGVAIGRSASIYSSNGEYGIAIGGSSSTRGRSGINIGYAAGSNGGNGDYVVAIGREANAKQNYSIQLGRGDNNEAGTFYVASYYNSANVNYKLMDADGTIPTARLTNAINKYSSMPTAGADYLGQIAQFTGTTDSTYTHGYIYECVSDGGNPATYSWTAVSVQAGGGGSLPSQTGNAGKFLTTDGTDASWSDKPLQNTATGGGALTILGTAATNNNATNIGKYSKATVSSATSYGAGAEATAQAANALGCWSIANSNCALAIGNTAGANAIGAIQINRGNNTNAGTMSVGLSTDGSTWNNYELLSSDGTIPAARHASLPATDGTYVLKLVITSGVPTLSWVAE